MKNIRVAHCAVILLEHHPKPVHLDFDVSDRLLYKIECTCGQTWHNEKPALVKELWARHLARVLKGVEMLLED